MTAWLAMTVAAVARIDDRDERPFRKEQEERVLARRRIAQHQRALAEIVQHRAPGNTTAEPGRLDRLASEMAEIGIERLGARHREKHRAERHEGDEAVREAGS